ncbi:thyroid receptor-interacting protein 11-like isoform X2 [Ischnura elegans]|nr:thyroid receptor-interacting protein 11-like isoform X2 [Ischnura elegans]
MEAEKDDLVDYLRAEIRALKIDKEKVEKEVEVFKKKCLCLEGGGLAAKDVSESASDGVRNDTEMLYTNNRKPDTLSGEGIGEMQQPPFNQEIKAVGSEPLDARGECDGSEEVPKDFVKLMDQISELTTSLSDAQLSVNRLQENEKELLRQIQRLKNEVLVSEDNVKSLTVQVENMNECNRQLEEKLEELDSQNTSTIDQLMAMVSSEKSENEVLTFGLKELQHKCESLESQLHLCLSDSKTQRREIELELEKEVLKFVPPELIPREPRGDGGEGRWVVVVGAVKGLAKASEEHRWKRDALERKLSEMAKEMREVKAECVALRAEIRREKGGVRVTTSEGLAPILETDGEEEEEEEGGGDGGEGTNWQDRCLALEEQMKRLMAERKDDEDEEDGIEEVVNEWTWQQGSEGMSHPSSAPLLLGDICVKDGEHVITTIANDVSGSEACGECSAEQSRVPTHEGVEQHVGEEARLEGQVGELRAEKDLLERTLKDAMETILHLEEKVQALSANLDVKAKSESEFLCKENELRSQLSEFEAKIDSLERLLQTKNVSIMELETEVVSLRNDMLRDREGSADVKQRMGNLEAQARELGTLLRSKNESLTEKEKLVNDLEGRLKAMERNAMEEKGREEERASRAEGEVASLRRALDVEAQLRGREAEEAQRRREGLEGRLASEVRLKEEALSRLEEERGRVEVMLSEAQREAESERRLKEEAEVRVGRMEEEIKQLNEQLSTCNGNQQQKDSLICDLVEKIKSLEMERERIMCVVGDKAREVSSLRSEKQRLMEAMSSMEKLRQQKEEVEVVGGTETPPAADLEDDSAIQLLSKLNNLQLESEQLAESYRQEQQRNKHLQNEVHELLQKETALQDELQRLRLHLIGVEDRYTKEAITAQEHISFLKSKLTQVEERLHVSSSAYTSASVRSNQQVESLEKQVRTLTEKREESKRQMVEVEKRVAQQAKDLMNLQTVLERFQQDKEREVLLVKERMMGEVSSWEGKCSQLTEEIASLKEQLKQAKEGLSAAARLSEQADKKSEIIASLKTEVKKLNASLISAEERLQDASLNVEGKVDRNLVKNLLLGYLSSPAQGSRRCEILRIVAMVLEFSEEERAKAELSDARGGKGWLGGLATGWSGHHSAREQDLAQPSLSEAFIRFLESESRPKTVPQLHMISESRAESTRSSTPATVGGGHSRTPSTSSTPPLLLSESLLPTLPTFSVASGSSGSCILKDVLKDS